MVVGRLTMEDTGDDIGGEGLGIVGGCKDASKHIPLACTLLIHNLYIVDNIFDIINILYFNYLLQNM